MILLLDAGNTRIKWQLRSSTSSELRAEGALGHEDGAGLAELAAELAATFGQPARIVGSNVAGTEVAERLATAFPCRPIEWLHSSIRAAGVHNLYAEPDQLGSDRWAALIGARQLHPGPCVVVMAGTATTIDLLAANGDFLGGLILPGVELMQQALAHRTAQLPLASGRFALQPRRTADAIHSGCLQAQAGAVERMYRQFGDEADTLCLLGGGAAESFASLLEIPLRRIDNLVLHGLAAVAAATPDLTDKEAS